MQNIEKPIQEEKVQNNLYPGDHLSISSLQSFDNCPFSFFMRYVCGIKPVQAEKAILGAQFQEALNAKYRGEDPAPLIAKMVPKSRGIATLLMMKANTFADIISLDQKYEVDLGFGVPIVFVPDILTKESIVENKFTTGYYNPKMVLTERQRIVYYVGVRKLFGFNPKVYYQLFNTLKKTVELIETPTGLGDIDSLMDWIELKLGQIQRCMSTGIWDIGVEHGFCDFKNTCPLGLKYGNKFKR